MPDGWESGFSLVGCEVVLNPSRRHITPQSEAEFVQSRRLWQTDMESAEGEGETLE